MQYVTVCCSVLKCVAVCVAVWRSVLQCLTMCCSVSQYVVVHYSVLQCVAVCYSVLQSVTTSCRLLQCVAACSNLLQCATVCYSVLQYAALCWSVLQCVLQCFAVRCAMRCCGVQCAAVCATMHFFIHVCFGVTLYRLCGEFHQILRPKQVKLCNYTTRNFKCVFNHTFPQFFALLVLKAQNSVVQINSLQYFLSLITNLLLQIDCLFNSSLLDPHTLILKPGLTQKYVRVCFWRIFWGRSVNNSEVIPRSQAKRQKANCRHEHLN